jgi:hypothetical protein
MKRLSPSLPDGLIRSPLWAQSRTVVGPMNPDPSCGKHDGSRTEVPRLIAGAYPLMAAHGDRLPRLTLKAGRRARDRVASMGEEWVVKLRGGYDKDRTGDC